MPPKNKNQHDDSDTMACIRDLLQIQIELLTEIRQDREEKREIMRDLHAEVKELKKENSMLRNQVKQLEEKGGGTPSQDVILDTLKEIEERKSKELSLVLINHNETRDSEDIQKSDDLEYIQTAAGNFGLSSDSVTDTFRHGRKDFARNGNRIMKIHFKDAHSKSRFMERFNQQQRQTGGHSYIRRDLTLRQRQQLALAPSRQGQQRPQMAPQGPPRRPQPNYHSSQPNGGQASSSSTNSSTYAGAVTGTDRNLRSAASEPMPGTPVTVSDPEPANESTTAAEN